MIVFSLFFSVLMALYYARLSYVVHSLVLLEFMSFFTLSLFGWTGQITIFGQFFLMVVFLVFVLEGVVGIISLILFTNHSGSSMVSLKSLSSL